MLDEETLGRDGEVGGRISELDDTTFDTDGVAEEANGAIIEDAALDARDTTAWTCQ